MKRKPILSYKNGEFERELSEKCPLEKVLDKFDAACQKSEIKKLAEEIKQSFEYVNPKNKEKNTPCRWKMNGIPIRFFSKKAIWNRIQDAETALRNHINHFCCGCNISKTDRDELYDELIRSKTLVLELL